jgi:UDP-N-acetylglucosamine 4,6-dehydratase
MELAATLSEKGLWFCLFADSDKSGEKDFEEFFTDNEILNMQHFDNLVVIKNEALFDPLLIKEFEETIVKLKKDQAWTKDEIVKLIFNMIPAFGYKEIGKYLASKM